MRSINKTLSYLLMIMVSLVIICSTSCKKDDDPQPTNTVTDVDGNVYNIITIGTQTWMASNLRVTKYNDGNAIPNVVDDAQWQGLTAGAYCNYNNTTASANSYGRLYNWYAVNSGKLCPAGWHVPSDAEWQTLINNLGGAAVAGGKLKEAGLAHWMSPNEGASNSSAWTGLPGGFRSEDGLYFSATTNGFWWTSTPSNDPGYPLYYLLDFNSAAIASGNDGLQSAGNAVRCIKD